MSSKFCYRRRRKYIILGGGGRVWFLDLWGKINAKCSKLKAKRSAMRRDNCRIAGGKKNFLWAFGAFYTKTLARNRGSVK
jgi:hypothetical protein